MSQVYEHNPGDHEDPLDGPTWLIGIVGTCLLIVIVLGLVALYYGAYDREQEVQVITRDVAQLNAHLEAQRERLEGPAREETREDVDGEEYTARVIPIDEAMDRYLERVNQSRR